MTSLLGTCITFEPTTEDLDSLTQQLCLFPRRALFDNSLTPAARAAIMLRCHDLNIEYLSENKNLGTAGGLNRLAALAKHHDIQWMFYFDQDSTFDIHFYGRLQDVAEIAAVMGLAAVGSTIHERSTIQPEEPKNRIAPARYLIASGTLFGVGAWEGVGQFDESLFLDTVDHEWCLRARVRGYRLGQAPTLALSHRIGRNQRAILGGRIQPTQHPSWRRELMWRNSIILTRRYWKSNPVQILRHLVARLVDSLACAWVFRDLRVIISSISGISTGFRDSAR
jgi:rhamnosyltransferase